MSSTRYFMLGPQSPRENLSVALRMLDLSGTVCSITAGWQEREAELGELERAIDLPVVDLALYQRGEKVFASDAELFHAHRERQTLLKAEQRLYRLRLHHYMKAALRLMNEDGSSATVADHRRAALSAVRSLDQQHIGRVRTIHDEFAGKWQLRRRAGIAQQIDELAHVVERSAAVLIAGGHVGALLSRARIFALDELLADKPVIGWSAGAMLMAERVVLFDDHSPRLYRVPEVFDIGLNCVKHVVPLPRASTRLDLDDSVRAAVLARRFSPAQCVTLDPGSLLGVDAGAITHADGAATLTRDGLSREIRTP